MLDNDRIKKLDKTGSIDPTLASGRSSSLFANARSSYKVVFSLDMAVDQRLTEFCWPFWLKKNNGPYHAVKPIANAHRHYLT